MKNFIYNIILLIFMLLILNICFITNVYASRNEDTEQGSSQLPDGAIYVSNFGQNGDGYIQVGWKAKDKNGIEKIGSLIYYK